MVAGIDVVVIASADIEWRAIRKIKSNSQVQHSPFGEFFAESITSGNRVLDIIYFQGGWGKISAAASCQYVIDKWKPNLLINLGTCGGITGRINRGEIVLVNRTIVYDLFEQMGDAEKVINHYTTDLNLSWLREPYPLDVITGLMVSADRDLMPGDLISLQKRFRAIAADWESGSIAFVASRNQIPCLILRGVSDLVNEQWGEAYGDIAIFERSAGRIMSSLINTLPAWLGRVDFSRIENDF